ncbi:hypothetical protein [Mycobacterium deserti]|uniref:Lipoprotein n=1 Tax=Mycobacterium deserti TaxID=2978347 RepID=A0ABT2MHI8_9MYCO|nr:hypothetical protein [Mycobacterium deserti]MCT7661702.1 hypothetical protein [Mycobacterium deserti]
MGLKRHRAMLVVATGGVAIALAGCHGGPQARADTVAVLGTPFGMAGGQQVSIGDASVRLRFIDVLEDSRCPADVECFWTGQARIAVSVVQDPEPAMTLEFNTNPAPGQNRQTIQTGDYELTLQRLDPYPRTPDEVPALEDYVATMVVRRAD